MSDQGGEARKPGPKMSDAGRALRDAAIVAQLHSGAKVADVAKRYELTTRQVRRILSGFQERRTALEQRPMEILEDVLRLYDEQIVNFAIVAAATIDSQPAVAISAMRQRAETIERKTQLLADLGKLPDNLEVFRAQEELDRIMRRMAELLEQAARGELAPVEVQVEFDRLIAPGPALWDVEATAVELGPGES